MGEAREVVGRLALKPGLFTVAAASRIRRRISGPKYTQ